MQKFKLLLLTITFIWISPAISTESNTQENIYGPVKPGEMLWKIAGKVRPDVNREQVIIAMLKANPLAFSVHCNFNSLKVGVKLRVPPLAEIQTMNAEAAKTEVNQQSKAWKNRSKQPIVCAPVTEEPSAPVVAPPPVEKPTVNNNLTTPTAPPPTVQPPTPSATLPPPTPPSVETTSEAKLVPEKTQPPPEIVTISQPAADSSFMLLMLAAGGLLAAFIIGWLLHKHIKSCVQDEGNQMPPRHET